MAANMATIAMETRISIRVKPWRVRVPTFLPVFSWPWIRRRRPDVLPAAGRGHDGSEGAGAAPDSPRERTMTIAEFQQIIDRTYGERDAARGLPATFMWLVEEIGEVARALREGEPEALEREVGDALAWLTTTATLAGVDLQAAAERYARGCRSAAPSPAPARAASTPPPRPKGPGFADGCRRAVAAVYFSPVRIDLPRLRRVDFRRMARAESRVGALLRQKRPLSRSSRPQTNGTPGDEPGVSPFGGGKLTRPARRPRPPTEVLRPLSSCRTLDVSARKRLASQHRVLSASCGKSWKSLRNVKSVDLAMTFRRCMEALGREWRK